jgi:hypothetical protein
MFTQSPAQADHKRQGPAQQLRMVTILIEDIRSGVTDHQLAEVRVPLYERPDRFWADGRDVCEALQGSPSRIDGVYNYDIHNFLHSHLILDIFRACKGIYSSWKISPVFSARLPGQCR